MKFINEKGKIFGIINIFDLLFLMFALVILIPLGVYCWNINHKLPQPEKKITITLKKYERLTTTYKELTEFLIEHKNARKYFNLPD